LEVITLDCKLFTESKVTIEPAWSIFISRFYSSRKPESPINVWLPGTFRLLLEGAPSKVALLGLFSYIFVSMLNIYSDEFCFFYFIFLAVYMKNGTAE